MKRLVFHRVNLFLMFAVVALVFGFVAAVITVQQIMRENVPVKVAQSNTAPVVPPSVTFAAMGDMLPHDSVVTQAKTTDGYNFVPYFTTIRPLYKNTDIVFCNAETPVAGEDLGLGGYPTFNAPSEFARDLSGAAGCNLVNMANNHIYDKAQLGVDQSRQTWESLGVTVSGANRNQAEQDTVSYVTKNGIKVAFVAFADFSNQQGYAPFSINLYQNEALVAKLMSEARANADAVVVSAHWGIEDSNIVSEDQTSTAQLLSDLGADVIIGTGPHVLQKVETLRSKLGNDTLVWYSIGNMLNTQLEVDQLTGVIAGFKITKDGEKFSVIKPTAHITFMSYDWSAGDRAAELLLTRTNIKLDSLKGAKDRISPMFADETYETRLKYVRDTLGTATEVVITP